jgi:hypothetical protein
LILIQRQTLDSWKNICLVTKQLSNYNWTHEQNILTHKLIHKLRVLLSEEVM